MSRTAGIVALLMVAVACGGPDPVSTGVPSDGAGARSTATTGATAATTTAITTTEGSRGPSAVRPLVGTTTVPSTTVASRRSGSTTAAPSTPRTTEPPGRDGEGADAGDDEPTFESEEVRPFDADNALPTGWAAFDFFLADALLRNGNTAASAAVSIGGEVVHRAAFGERTPGTGDAAEPQDRFRIASISKPLTAIALLRLFEDGVVGLDEPIGERVAAHVGVTNPSASVRDLTIRRLLTHTSGFGKYNSTFFGGGAADCAEAARIGLSRSSGGGGYEYSNMNYCVAHQLIEALTGKRYEDVVYEQVLTPLGISGPRLAATFDPGPDEILHPTTLGRNYMEALGGAGGWIATPQDLVTVMDALDPSTPGYTLLEDSTLEQMMTPVGGQRGQRGYGLGLLLYGPGRYGHTGTIEQTHAMVMNRGDGVTWAVTVAGPYPDDTPRLEGIVNAAFQAGGFIAG